MYFTGTWCFLASLRLKVNSTADFPIKLWTWIIADPFSFLGSISTA